MTMDKRSIRTNGSTVLTYRAQCLARIEIRPVPATRITCRVEVSGFSIISVGVHLVEHYTRLTLWCSRISRSQPAQTQHSQCVSHGSKIRCAGSLFKRSTCAFASCRSSCTQSTKWLSWPCWRKNRIATISIAKKVAHTRSLGQRTASVQQRPQAWRKYCMLQRSCMQSRRVCRYVVTSKRQMALEKGALIWDKYFSSQQDFIAIMVVDAGILLSITCFTM